jgi:preprotein translocase subunit SecF
MARRARVAAGAPEVDPDGAETGAADPDGPDLTDDAALAGELRRERAVAAAAGVPARTGKAQHQRRPASRSGRPSGKASRPSGKKRR